MTLSGKMVQHDKTTMSPVRTDILMQKYICLVLWSNHFFYLAEIIIKNLPLVQEKMKSNNCLPLTTLEPYQISKHKENTFQLLFPKELKF